MFLKHMSNYLPDLFNIQSIKKKKKKKLCEIGARRIDCIFVTLIRSL